MDTYDTNNNNNDYSNDCNERKSFGDFENRGSTTWRRRRSNTTNAATYDYVLRDRYNIVQSLHADAPTNLLISKSNNNNGNKIDTYNINNDEKLCKYIYYKFLLLKQ